MYELTIKYNGYLKAITILQINYINMPQLLSKINMNPPYDATYQAVKVIESTYDSSLLQTSDIVVVTTGTYHTVMLEIVYGANYAVRGQYVRKLFIRYAYYVVQNEIKYINGLIILKQVLPEEY